MNLTRKTIDFLRAEDQRLSEDLLIILGPTASGKTNLGIALAKELGGEIISADSRQVYRGMDIGTGKDIREYGDVPYHLIDIAEPGEKYNISRFLEDFETAYQDIRSRGKKVLVCGGTGFYIEALLTDKRYVQIPTDLSRRQELEELEKDVLKNELERRVVPPDFAIDFSSKKRMIRALEILDWLASHPSEILSSQPTYSATIIGIDPDLHTRRQRISERLRHRLKYGMINETENLLRAGLSHDDLLYYGLEYRYMSYYLQGKMTYEEFVQKLETEIHRYAKRQMTYFRKMERDGVVIHWMLNDTVRLNP